MEVRCPLCACEFEVEKSKTPLGLIRAVIEAYKIAKEIKTNTLDKELFKRHSGDAKTLLDYLGNNLDLAIDCIAEESIELRKFNPDWHLGTIAKRAVGWRVKSGR